MVKLLILSLLLLSTPGYAEINIFDGLEMATINVNGEEITFPVGDSDRRSRIYFLKKALDGDKYAMDTFLGGKSEEWFFIGRDIPLWLHIINGKVEIVKP